MKRFIICTLRRILLAWSKQVGWDGWLYVSVSHTDEMRNRCKGREECSAVVRSPFEQKTVKCTVASSRGHSTVTNRARKMYNREFSCSTRDCWPLPIPNGLHWTLTLGRSQCITFYGVRFEILCARLSMNKNMIWRFVMPLSVGQTIKVRRTGGWGCRQETYKKRMVLLCSRENDSETENMAPSSRGFYHYKKLKEEEKSLTSDFMRKRKSPLPLPVTEENQVTQQTRYVTAALNHGPIKCLGRSKFAPVPNSTSRTRTKAQCILNLGNRKWWVVSLTPRQLCCCRTGLGWVGSTHYTDVVTDKGTPVQLGIEPQSPIPSQNTLLEYKS
jgi:hypothetical protein